MKVSPKRAPIAKLTRRRFIFWLTFLFKKNRKIPEIDKRLIIRTDKSEKNKDSMAKF